MYPCGALSAYEDHIYYCNRYSVLAFLHACSDFIASYKKTNKKDEGIAKKCYHYNRKYFHFYTIMGGEDMASQWGTTRKYTSVEEGVTKPTVQCPLCHVNVVPRGITSTRYASVAGGEKHCPNCGKDLTRTWSKLT